MDNWKFYDIIHRHHVLMNPVDENRLHELLDLLRLARGSSVIDIGSGKGEMLIRLVEKYHIHGIGIDKSPFSIKDANKLKQQRVPKADLKFIEMDAANYKPNEHFDLSMCIGASWIYNGYKGTVKALAGMTKPAGLIMIGEPYWIKDPPEEYLKTENIARDLFNTHYGNVTTGENEGLRIMYSLVSNNDSWDKYEGLHWYAADQYATANPDDPDLAELLSRVSKDKQNYLKWERDSFGWAIYLFRKLS